MAWHVFFLVLLASLFHASWNIIVKGGRDKLFEIGLNSLGGAFGSLFLLPFASFPGPLEWLFLLLSLAAHLGYALCMAAAYRQADLSLVYPVMRGAAPVLTAIALALFGVGLAAGGWAGIALLCAGILLMAAPVRRRPEKGADETRRNDLRGVFLALRASFMIMGYTLADGFGAREAGSGLGYAAWLFALNAIPIHVYILTARGRQYLVYMSARAGKGLFGGLCGLASYGIAIWAMTVAPIALVAALRETSALFGLLLAVIFLGERITPQKIAATLLMLAGAAFVRLD